MLNSGIRDRYKWGCYEGHKDRRAQVWVRGVPNEPRPWESRGAAAPLGEGIDPDDEFTHEAQELRRYSTESDEEDPFVALSWYVDNSSRDQHHPTPGEGKRQRA